MSKKTVEEKRVSASEVAQKYGVDPKTITRWAQAGLIPCIRTVGGHRRYLLSEVETAVAARNR